MPYDTDERLKSFLDTDQLHREQMCLAILSQDKRFSDVRPRHPRGGPDGGRDIDATFRGEERAYAAVGFINQADDSAEKKRRVQEKFSEDLRSALAAEPKPSVFVFLTNMALSIGEKEALSARARSEGISYCDIFDRERLRIALDSTDGLAVRFQYLDLPLSTAEQTSFFAKWGDDINSVITTGFQKIQDVLDQLLFLQEASRPISSLVLTLELDRTYAGEEIGHFRAFCELYLKEPKLNIISVLFGSSDLADRFRSDFPPRTDRAPPGIRFGVAGAQWEQYLSQPGNPMPGTSGASHDETDAGGEKYTMAGWSSSVGTAQVRFISATYGKNTLFRLQPVLALSDLEEALFIPIVNRSLAQKVKGIHVIANEYKLLELPTGSFYVDETRSNPAMPTKFSAAELTDPWVLLRPKDASMFQLRFAEEIPRRRYASRPVRDTLPRPRSG